MGTCSDDEEDGDMEELYTQANINGSYLCFVPRSGNMDFFLIYPDDPIKSYWDIFIVFVLIFACLVTPCRIAFVDDELPGWIMANYIVDGMFLIDIMVIFNTAYYDDDFQLITNRKIIAIDYVQGWFLIDLLAIIPFDIFFASANNLNDIVRITRIGRMYKLVKLTRLFKIFKMIKDKNKMFKYL